MKHFIIVKFKNGYDYVKEYNNIEELFKKSLDIPEVKDVIIHKSNSSKVNRYDLMIEMTLTENGLQEFDSSIVHRKWKEIYGEVVENKVIFDCE